MPAWSPAYLIHGDDHDRVAERRSRLKASAEQEVGPEGIEQLQGDAATPSAVAGTLSAMTLGLGRRFVLVDGTEGWSDDEVAATVAPALAGIDPATTTVAFVALEERKRQAPAALIAAVQQVGGTLVREEALKARDLPRWAIAQAQQLGLTLSGAAAQALVAQVGERRVRLQRELEKLALEHGPGAQLDGADVEAAVADAAQRQVWGLVDAIAAGDRTAAVAAYLSLRAQGEPLARLTGVLQSRIRTAWEIARRLEAGEDRGQIAKAVRMPPWQLDRRIREARDAGPGSLALAVDRIARLELAARGDSPLDADTEALRMIGAVTGR